MPERQDALDRVRMGEHLHEAEVLARKLGTAHRLARIVTFSVIQCLDTGDYPKALTLGREALSIARSLGDRSIEVLATTFLGLTHAARGEFREAATLLERNVALDGELRYERFGAPAIQSALSGAYLANTLSQLGQSRGFQLAIHEFLAVDMRLQQNPVHSEILANLLWGFFAKTGQYFKPHHETPVRDTTPGLIGGV